MKSFATGSESTALAVRRELETGGPGDDKQVFIGPASPDDAREGYPWRWVVVYRGERRGGVCATREAALREAAAVLELLKRRTSE
jgi:hypothetical protein